MTYRLAGIILAVAATAVACSEGARLPTTPTLPPPAAAEAVLLCAGDIAVAGSTDKAEATAKLLDRLDGTVCTLGDNAYPDGKLEEFNLFYHPAWGRHLSRTRPSPGNHDYNTPGAAGYYAYYGARAGSNGRGYYSYRAGPWLVLSLNSNPADSGVSTGEQIAWLQREIQASPTPCTLAYWHHPLFSSGQNGGSPVMRDVWQALYDLGADVVLVGHDHLYERFAPQDASGVHDPARGLVQFTVGTGGVPLYPFRSTQPNSVARNNQAHGVLKLTLRGDQYQWEFIPIDGSSYTDSGIGFCH